MKKLFFITILTLIAFTLSACNNNKVKSNTIMKAELTDREEAILAFTSNQSFIFDFSSEKYNEVSVWIEKYEFGNLVNEQIGYISTGIADTGSIILTANESNTTPNQIFFNIGINSDGITNSSSTTDTISNNSNEGVMTVWGSIGEEMEITNEEMALGSIYFSWGDGSTSSLTSSFYKDVEVRLNEIENYDVVYLLRSKFVK